MQAYADEKGLPYLDFNLPENDPGINWTTDTVDAGTHLNLLGAQRTTDVLGQYLLTNFDLPDHRGRPGFADWDAAAAEYAAALPELLEKVNAAAGL